MEGNHTSDWVRVERGKTCLILRHSETTNIYMYLQCDQSSLISASRLDSQHSPSSR